MLPLSHGEGGTTASAGGLDVAHLNGQPVELPRETDETARPRETAEGGGAEGSADETDEIDETDGIGGVGERAAEQAAPRRDFAPFLTLRRRWATGDVLKLELPMCVRTERLADARVRYSSLHSVLCGPVVLAGLTHGPRTIIGDPARPHDWLRPVPASAASELRSLRLGGGGPPGGASGGYVAVGASGLRVVTSKALPKPPAFNAPDATWRRVCYPSADQC